MAGTHGGIDYQSAYTYQGSYKLTPSVPAFVDGSTSSLVSTIIANVASSTLSARDQGEDAHVLYLPAVHLGKSI